MTKKIIFIGPPGVGKTTLRKIFFEYQSAEQLMQFALDPTYGAESIVLNLGQQIGIFDLAGQENQKWLETGEKEIFLGTTYILTVVDATASIDSIVDFTAKVVGVRDEICPRAMIFLLVHKIDLLDGDDFIARKKSLHAKLRQVHLLKIEFTSIVRAHFLRTLKIFKNIIDATVGDEIPLESVNTALIKDFLFVLNQFKGYEILSIAALLSLTKLSPKRLEEIINALADRKLVELLGENGITCRVKLILEMDQDLISLLESFSMEKLDLVETSLVAVRDDDASNEVPPFIGFFIADLDGRSILVVESRELILRQSLGMDGEKSIDLIPPFISALTSFSKEIRLVNMADFKLKGQNAIMYVFEYDQYNLILFLHPDMNIDSFKAEIQDFFTRLVKKNAIMLQAALNTGNVTHLAQIQNEGKDWLLHLNEVYLLNSKNVDFFDMARAQQIYKTLDEISTSSGKMKGSIETDVRLLKRRLITAIMEKDVSEFREIAKISKNLGLKN